MTDNERQFYTIPELASEAGISATYIRRLVVSGKLAGTKYGNTWIVPVDAGREWLRQRQAKQ